MQILTALHHQPGPRISDGAIRAAFAGPDWTVERLTTSQYRGIAEGERRTALGLAADGPVDLLAWLATIRRVDVTERN